MMTLHLTLPEKKERDARRFAYRRAALSTLELLVSISIAPVLTLGLSENVFAARRSLQVPEQPTQTKMLVGNDYGRFHEAFSEAVELPVNSALQPILITPR